MREHGEVFLCPYLSSLVNRLKQFRVECFESEHEEFRGQIIMLCFLGAGGRGTETTVLL